MTRLLTWLLAASVLFSATPAAAQSSPDAETPSGERSADGASPIEPATALPGRTNFPYGVLVAELSNAPRARAAGFRVLATTVSWRRTQPAPAQYPFEQTDQFGRTAANDLTNIVTAARTNGLKVGLRLIEPRIGRRDRPGPIQLAEGVA